MSKISVERIGKLRQVGHRAFMRALDRHAPGEPIVAALVMESYEEFLAEDFKTQMTEQYGLEYPINLKVVDKENDG